MSWTPDEPPDDEQDDSPDELPDESSDQSAPEPHGPYTRENPLTFLVPEPILLRIERVEKPGAAPGEQPVAFSRAGPDEVLLAVNAYPAPLVDAFFASDAFGEPVIVVGAAWDEDDGEAEPWAASATLGGTSYEEAVGSDDEDDDEDDEEDEDAEPHFPLVIG